MEENKNIDKKSLKFLNGKNTDWSELAKDCVCFANAQGGFGEIHQRIGKEINQYKVKRMLKNMVDKQILKTTGKTGGMKYQLKQNLQENG